MKYATYRGVDGRTTWGLVRGDGLIDLGPGGRDVAPSLREAIACGALAGVGDDIEGDPVEVTSVELLPPIPDPAKILCVGLNYETHRSEAERDPGAVPVVFIRFADSQMGHGAPALRPGSTDQFDYEGELALVVAGDARHVREEDAFDHVAGYSVYNDFSVRDWQRATTQWTAGKNFPGTGAFGPYLVTDVPDVDALQVVTRVNGETRQSGRVADLIFSIPRILAYVTSFTALTAGDVIVTGTPGGVGLFMEPQGMLHDGDVVEVEIDGLGTLTNRVEQLA